MKSKRLLSVLVAMALLMSAIFVPTAISVSAEETAFKSQHMVVDFSKYNIVDYATNGTSNNVYMNANGPMFSIQQETVGEAANDYLQIDKTADQKVSWEPHHCIVLNSTGSTSWDGHYRIQQNGKYRLTFKYKLTKEETASWTGVYLRTRASADLNLKSSFNKLNGSQDLSSTYLAPTETWTEKTVEFSMDTFAWSGCASSLAFFVSTGGTYNFGYTLSIDDVVVDRLGSVTFNYEDGTTEELWGIPKATSADKYNSVCTEFSGESIEFPDVTPNVWSLDEDGVNIVDTNNTVFTSVTGKMYYEVTFSSSEEIAFKSQHTVVDFSKYNIVDYVTNNSANNVYMNSNGPTFAIKTETVNGIENPYLSVSKTAAQNDWTVKHHSILINPTGGTNWETYYRIQQNGKYRLTFKYKLTKDETVNWTEVNLSVRASADYNMNGNFNKYGSNVELGKVYLAPTTEWTEKTVEFTMDTFAWSGCTSSLAFYLKRSGEFGYDLSIDDVVVDRLGSVTLNNSDGSTSEIWGAPIATADNLHNKACSTYAGENIDYELSSEIYSESDSTAIVNNIEYYSNDSYTVAAPVVYPSSNGINVYTKSATCINDTYQMAFTGFESDIYNANKPNDYLDGDVNWYYMPDSLFRTSAGLSITSDEAFTGAESLKYIAKGGAGNYRAVYIGNKYEFKPERTYAVSFYVKPSENNTAKTIKLGVRGGYGNGIWSSGSNNIEVKTVDLTKTDWQKVTILYTPNKVETISLVNSANAYYVPQLFVDYINTEGGYTEGAELYIDTVAIEVVVGDANGDGIKNIIDLVRMKKICVAPDNYSAEDIKAGNLDTESEGVQATDISYFRRELLFAEPETKVVPSTNLTDINGNTIDLSSYNLSWNDEFNGTSLNPLKWATDSTTPTSDIKKSDENITVADGIMTMNTVYENGVYNTSSTLQTDATMNFKYGYIEFRAKLPYIKGAWSGIWSTTNVYMNPETFIENLDPANDNAWYNADYNSEIDFLESGNAAEGFTTNLHNFANGNDYQYQNRINFSLPENFDVNGWHIYSYIWTESELIMFVDGKEFGRYNLNDTKYIGNRDMAGFDDWMKLKISNGVYSPEYCNTNSWAEDFVIENSNADLDMQIDYIRIYQQTDDMIHIMK